MASPLVLPFGRALSANAAALSGAKLYAYLTGTTTPAAVYTTSDRSVAHSNPVEADSAGLFPAIYLDPAVTYRFVLKTSAGVSLPGCDFDPVSVAAAGDIQFTQAGAGAATRTAQAKLREAEVTLEDFGGVADGAINAGLASGTANDAAWAAAMTYLASIGGGTLKLGRGKYFHSSALTLPVDGTISLAVTGSGKTSSQLISNHTGHGIRSTSPLNISTGINVSLRDFGMRNTNAANTGGAYYDQAGTYIDLTRLRIQGFKYGGIFDQSELLHIDLVDFRLQLFAGVWLVNGEETELGNTGSLVGYTNQITIERSNFNGAQWGIIDDGGYDHSLRSNNYNGNTLGHIRSAGSFVFQVSGGEFEASNGPCLYLGANKLSGAGVGQSTAITVNSTLMAPLFLGVPNSAIDIVSAGSLRLTGNQFASTGDAATPVISGGVNALEIVEEGNDITNAGGPLFATGDFPTRLFSSRYLQVRSDRMRPASNGTMTLGDTASAWTNCYVTTGYYVNGVKVVGAQGAAVADATDAASVITQLNALLARCRAHGIIAS